MEHSKEVLDWARQKWAEADALEKKNWEAAFPELKESEDERIRKALIELVYSDVNDLIGGVEKRLCVSYLEKQKEQQPAEWSEEDEENFKWFDKLFRAESVVIDGRDIPQDKYLWLKSLRPQPKAELTLLDENIINAAVAFVEQNNHFNCWRGIDKHAVIKALRSLKPHWKPSDEQMNALFSVLPVTKGGGGRVGDILQTLYDDLKKL